MIIGHSKKKIQPILRAPSRKRIRITRKTRKKKWKKKSQRKAKTKRRLKKSKRKRKRKRNLRYCLISKRKDSQKILYKNLELIKLLLKV